MDVSTMFSIFTAYGFESDDVLTDDRKLEALNETYWDANSREAWPFLQATATYTFAGGVGTPVTPATDINTVEAIYRTSDGKRLEPWRRDDFFQTYASQLTLAGSPSLYYFEAGALNFYPQPSSSDSVVVKYSKIPPALTLTTLEAAVVFPPKYHRSILVMGTLSRLALAQDDVDMSNAYERLYEKALALAVGDLLDEQSDRSEFIHVNDPDNWDYS
jgi:hypothetical protein